jgi:molybdate/tungstate transport system ATP-binding protein
MLKIQNISKKIGKFEIKNVSLDIHEGEYFVILGRSGAGKSILLELIAGLLIPDTGQIFIDNNEVTHEKIQKRKVGLVFQNQSLFPHISVKNNILYPLKAVKKRKRNALLKVAELAEALGILHLLDRNPSTLSLGEGQRVALARTLVTEPACLLLDEPLSSLDTTTKTEIRRLLRSINRGTFYHSDKKESKLIHSSKLDDQLLPKLKHGAPSYDNNRPAYSNKQTIIHVTHDYEEAIALADRVAVFENGKIIQVGEPTDIFHHPKSDFIANFIGIKNFYRGRLEKSDLGTSKFVIDSVEDIQETVDIDVSMRNSNAKLDRKPSRDSVDQRSRKLENGASYGKNRLFYRNTFYVSISDEIGEGCLVLRSEDITISNTHHESSARNSFDGIIKDIETVRNGIEVTVDIGGIDISSLITEISLKNLELHVNKKVFVSFKASAARFIK